jgi:hypothetical protein
MRQLQFLQLTEDGTTLVLQPPEGGEHFAVPVDDMLRSALVADASAHASPAGPPEAFALSAAPAPATEAPPAPEPRPEPAAIVPRDIQVRVRAGESPAEVAEALGVPLERIVRFAEPVVDERRRIAEEARRARARHTAPESAENTVVVFGEAVDARFTAHGISPADVRWDSHRRDDGEWVVVAHWVGGSDEHEAAWIFHRVSRTVTPTDDTAADLLSDRPIRPVMAPPAPPRLVVAPPLAPGIVAFPPMPDAQTGPIAVVEDVFDQEAQPSSISSAPSIHEPSIHQPSIHQQAVSQSPRPAAVQDAKPAHADDDDSYDRAAAPTPSRTERVIDFDAPPLPLGIAEPAGRPTAVAPRNAANREPTEEERAARARIPSWDDILLGVRRKSD